MESKFTASIPRPPFLLHICVLLSHVHLSPDRKTSGEEDSHLLPLSLHLATNRGDSRLCWGQAASAELICKDWHPDDDFGGVIYSWQDHILSYGREPLDFDIYCPDDTSNSTSATPAWFILRPWEQESHLSWCRPCWISRSKQNWMVKGHWTIPLRDILKQNKLNKPGKKYFLSKVRPWLYRLNIWSKGARCLVVMQSHKVKVSFIL